MCRSIFRAWLASVAIFAATGTASAFDIYHHPAEHTMCRAGYPNRVARWAKFGFDKHYSANWVGGGSPFCHGEPRTLVEGTWGLDYNRHLLPINVWLKWNHGRKYQDGYGAYKTDGPYPKVIFPLYKL